ncbi:hypothetical protein [Halorubrum trueperi]|uniref:Uncharacterized protein n=1 Tax=Halorubrum trueperi TaxID=2004704 RepID=A0ABD5UKU0_9EURY
MDSRDRALAVVRSLPLAGDAERSSGAIERGETEQLSGGDTNG